MLRAVTSIGIVRGLDTFLQLVREALPSPDSQVLSPAFMVPAVKIEDAPRFPWRGVMVDSCRHFHEVAVIKRLIDSLSFVKLNVFHWHLSEDQGFRVESRAFPHLHQKGSDGLYYTQDEIRVVVSYAAERGVS